MARPRFALSSIALCLAAAACGGIAVIDAGGAGGGGSGGGGGWDGCAGKSCGDPCSPCDPKDPACVVPAVEYACDEKGQCTSGATTCPVTECSDAVPCPAIDGACMVCDDGSVSCPSLSCVAGQCLMDYEPNCPCTTADATGVGACKALFGYSWGKLGCEMIAGCSCEGVDCDELFDTLEACQAQVCFVK